MRQLKHTKRELALRFSNLGRYNVAASITNLSRFGALGLGVMMWLGYRQAPILWIVLVTVGSLLILAQPFIPHLYPEIATCTFNKGFNRLTIVHEIPQGRKRQRQVNHYLLNHIEQVHVYRQRIGLWRYSYVMIIRISLPENTIIHINGVSDQVLIQTGIRPIKLLSKTVKYHLGQRTSVDWSFIEVPKGLRTSEMGRRVMARNSMERIDPLDFRRLAHLIEKFIWSP